MSARQFYIVLAISVITMKMQKLPSLVTGELGKDSWIFFLVYTLINIIGIVLVFLILKHLDIKTVLKSSKNKIFNIFRFVLMIMTLLYFLVQALLVYEHIQGLFANTLFDSLSWSFFSLLLIFAVFFLAHRGIENIALNFELYTWIIVVSLVLLSIFGATQTDYSVILPFETINFEKILSKLQMFSCWFGDFFLVLYLGGKARDIKLSKTLFIYTLSMLFMTFLVVVFIGIYDKVAPLAPGLISVISEQSLLDLSIGRVDWFLILFTEMGAILACSVNLYFANLCLHAALPKAKPIYLNLFNVFVLYVLDIFVLVDLNAKVRFFCGFMCYVTNVVSVLTIFVLFGLILFKNFKKVDKKYEIKSKKSPQKPILKRDKPVANKSLKTLKKGGLGL